MAEVEVSGPFRGHFLCKVSLDTALGFNSKEYSLVDHPLGKESKDFTSSGKDSFVFIKAKGVIFPKLDDLESLSTISRSKRRHRQAEPCG